MPIPFFPAIDYLCFSDEWTRQRNKISLFLFNNLFQEFERPQSAYQHRQKA